MKLQKIIEIVDADIICGDLSTEIIVDKAFASDLMSDVLTLNENSVLLITGLVNMQTIRTAEMADIRYILFVRNKKPSKEMVSLAKREGITIVSCQKSMFLTCGLLLKAGLEPVY
jgi:hypothetical protein